MGANPQTIDSWLANHAIHQPDKIALRFEGESWSYQALHEWVTRLASGLCHELGLERGDRIAFYGHNSASEIALFFAAARLGLIVVPLNWRLAVDELRYIVSNADAEVVVHGPEFAPEAAELAEGCSARLISTDHELPHLSAAPAKPLPEAALTDPFLIVYTSGTTGRPKGAVLTQEAVLWNVLSSLHAHDFTAEDHVLNVLPLFHVGGINIQTMPCFFIGGTVSVHSGFDPGAAVEALRNDGITSSVFVPTMLQALLARPDWDPQTFPRLRMLTTGSTDVPADLLQTVNGQGVPMVQVYGATETGPITSYQRAAEAMATAGSIGRPAAHVRVRLVRSDGADCGGDEPGEIWVKGPNIFSHYWAEKEATERAIEDGWFKTGDVAYRDGQGLLWFVGRTKHVIISGGENIYPAEIERLIARLPGLREAAVVGRPDPRWGEVPVVVAAAEADGPSRDEILAACDGQIARYKWPKDVVFVDALPRNALGKVIIDDVRKLVR